MGLNGIKWENIDQKRQNKWKRNLDSDSPHSNYLEWKFQIKTSILILQKILAKNGPEKEENEQKRTKRAQHLRNEVRFRFPTFKLFIVEIFMSSA